MRKQCRTNRTILAYLEQYEVITAGGKDSIEISERVFAELINDGYLLNELVVEGEVADILLIDYEYEFSDEKNLIALSNDITLSAFIDCRANT